MDPPRMPGKPDSGRKALEIGADAAAVAALVVDVGGTGGALVGGKLLWDAMTAGSGWRRRRQAEAYLQFLADALGEDDAASLAVDLDGAGENPVWETIEEGFRAMMAAINEAAKRSVALLVADYVVRQQLPDREFQLFGGLLAASDDLILRGLLAVTTQLMEVYAEPTSHLRPSEPVYTYDLLRGKNTTKQIDIYFHRHDVVDGKPKEATHSNGEACPLDLKTIVRLLDRYELGELPLDRSVPPPTDYRSHRHPQGGTLEFRAREAAAARLRRLHGYLQPAFIEVPPPGASER